MGLKMNCGILLLAGYLAGNAVYGFIHLLHGHQTLISHSADQEKDPCHRAIYHFEKENICKHNSHVATKEKCDQCYIFFHSDQMFVRNPAIPSDDFEFVISGVLTPTLLSDVSLHHPSRAPPLL